MATARDDAVTRYDYGPDPSQWAELHLPSAPRRPGTLVLLHGGWWGPRFGAGTLDPVAADLADRGWPVWNVEYRRRGLGGGYPETLLDVAAAVDLLATVAGVGDAPVVAVGHSAGGHLAVWAAGRAGLPEGAPGAAPVVDLAGAVSLAGAVDLASTARDRDGDGAAVDLMGGGPDDRPGAYAVADPLAQVPIPVAVRCVHARADDRVPFARSVAYVEAARRAGQDAALLEVEGDHFSVADPTAASWPTVVGALEEMCATGG